MQENNSSYRIRTGVGSDAPNVLNVHLTQTYDVLEVLSLKLTQTNDYKYYESPYGIIVGRVLANDAFGIPNAKVSVFISVDDAASIAEKGLYPFSSIREADNNGIRYNLLPDEQVNACHQNVGTFPNKRLVLDNNDIIEVFDKYWKYTTVTNEAGDYMLYGIPTGDQQIHVDVDLSDIGVLSQRPRDMVYKGYNINLFESPNKFKQSRNLDSLSQIYAQNKGVYVYPYWGDTSNTQDTIAITRCDIQLEYKFEPTCVFMGCIVTDQGENAIGKSCAATEGNGRMEKLMAGEGSIEMIRKTLDGKVEEFQIKGNRLIDGDGVWCYQIPMNLDYVRTDEFGNIVPTDNPNKGIPTRTRVRFRFTVDETPNDAEARKRCRYLVPNNPRLDDVDYPVFTRTKEIDYEFGSATRDESYKDLFWNQVYTVKSYIPRLQKNSSETNRKHTGIKAVNYYGYGTNPFPYNSMTIKLSFTYRLICVITKFIIYFVGLINMILSTISVPFCVITGILKPMTKIPIIGKLVKPLYNLFKAIIFKCIGLGTEFCDDDINRITYYIGCYGCSWTKTQQDHNEEQQQKEPEEQEAASNPGMVAAKDSTLFTCIEQQLAQDNNAVNFNFTNDWINGALYFPLWYRKLTPKKSFLFGLFRKKAKDEWCAASRQSKGLRIYQACALNRGTGEEQYENYEGETITPYNVRSADDCGDKCHEQESVVTINNGVILTKENMYGQTIYYYQAGEFHPDLVNDYMTFQYSNHTNGEFVLLFATDIVLLGSLNDCDQQGIPQFFKYLTETTYNMPSNILFTDGNVVFNMDADSNLTSTFETFTEATGCDWGNVNDRDQCGDPDGGLFYSIGCSTIETITKSCLNLSRICEFGVYLDETKFIENITGEGSITNDNDYEENILIPDGYISYDELYNIDARSMFATMNGNYLRTKLNNKTGLYEYDFRYLYPENFDGSLYETMKARQTRCNNITYQYNYKLETFSRDYYKFRMGDKPFFYDYNSKGVKNGLPKYENSYYFYFGLNQGKTAIQKFNSEFFATCENVTGESTAVIIETQVNTWCNDDENDWDGNIKLDFTGISTPYTIYIYNTINTDISFTISNINSEKIYFSREEINVDEDNSFEGYTWIDVDDEEEPLYFINGTYMIEVEDAQGNVSSSEISMNSKYLSFNTDVDNFNEPNNILLERLSNYCEISKNMDGYDNSHFLEDKSITREIGGSIGIYDIYYNNETVFNSEHEGMILMITIKPSIRQSISENDWKCRITLDNQGNLINGNVNINNAIVSTVETCDNSWDMFNKDNTYDNNRYIFFGMPRGDVDYDVTVQQLCPGNDGVYITTGNKITQTVTVGEPVPYKLFINGLDYDIIKDFTTGWQINGDTNNPRVNIRGNINGWLNISDPDNGFYKWENNELYTAEYYENMGMTPDEAIEKVNEMKSEFIEDMKNTFYMTCPNTAKTFVFSVQTDDKPYSVKSIYRDEEINDEGTMNQLASCENTTSDSTSIEGFEIPTITNIDNADFGNEEYVIQTGICFAIDKTAQERLGCNGESRLKSPYWVACVNNIGTTKPLENVGVSGNEEDEYTLEGNVSGYFGFHVIDKTLRINQLAWAYFNEIPYYWPTNTYKYGQSLTMNGLFTGIVNNGISTSTIEMAEFEEQLLGNNILEIETYKTTNNPVPDEDAIPTKRVIVGKNNNEYPHYKIELPYATGDIQNQTTYASLANKRTDLSISDESCQISDDIYGSMNIRLSGDSINDCKDKSNSILKVNVSNGGDVNTMYVFATQGGNDYIVNRLTDEIGGYDDYGIMRFEVTEEELKNNTFQYIQSQTEDENDETILNNTTGYGTTGVFDMKNIGPFEIPMRFPLYIVAVSDNNCRCISPVYDFSDVKVTVVLQKQIAYTEGSGSGSGTASSEVTIPPTEEGGESTTETVETDVSVDVTTTTPVTTYKFGVRIDNANELYYFRYYTFTAEVSCTVIQGNVIGGTFRREVDLEDTNPPVAWYTITEDLYNQLQRYINVPIIENLLLKKTTVIAEDVTGLKHNCIIQGAEELPPTTSGTTPETQP